MQNRSNYIEIPKPNMNKAPKNHNSPVHSADNSPKKFTQHSLNAGLFNKLNVALKQQVARDNAENCQTAPKQ